LGAEYNGGGSEFSPVLLFVQAANSRIKNRCGDSFFKLLLFVIYPTGLYKNKRYLLAIIILLDSYFSL